MDLEQEKALVERAKTDAQAFGALYEEHFGKIFGYVLHRTASVPVAQDVTEEVFFKALKNIGSFRWRGIPFSAWLFRIAEHEAARTFIHNGHDRVLTEDLKLSLAYDKTTLDEEAAQAERDFQKEAAFFAMQKCIVKLPPVYQQVLTLRFFENKSLAEICQITGKRDGTVKSLLHRGLERLRKLMQETGATF
jgi:RNA polymerase sigma-70 factor, ECF subfamily